MRVVASYNLRIEGRGATFADVKNAVLNDGWRIERLLEQEGEEMQTFVCEHTPLVLAVHRDDRNPNLLQVFFIEKWFRCALAGGWALKLRNLPDDIIARLVASFRSSGLFVQLLSP